MFRFLSFGEITFEMVKRFIFALIIKESHKLCYVVILLKLHWLPACSEPGELFLFLG